MLNNLTNFFNLITGRRIKRTLERTDLIPLGTYDQSFGGGYKPTAIQAGDLLDGVTVHADGTTIIGDGSVDNPLIAVVSGTPVTYSRVCFVDPVNGVDATGAINIFDKPFLTIGAARTAAAALPSISIDNRALVYIRRGQYNNAILTLTNNVDFYCEPGVVFTGQVQIRDNGVAVNSNVYGSLKINAWTSTTIPLVITGGSTVTFEFDWISSNAAAMELNTTNASNRITIKGNYIYSSTIGQGFGVTIRQAANVSFNLANSIEAPHSVFAFRFYSGTTVINCPNINLVSGNAYGGNYKQAIMFYDASSVGKITINGNITNKDTIDYGGIGSLVTLYASSQPKLTINGNLYGGVTKALDGNTAANGVIEINGNISSSKDYTVWAYGSGQIVIKDAIIINNRTTGPNYAIAVNGLARVFLKDCYISNTRTNSDLIVINGPSTNLVLDGCQVFSPGASGSSISSTVGNVTVRVNNCRFNKAVTVNITDLLSPSGITIDTNIITPIVIN